MTVSLPETFGGVVLGFERSVSSSSRRPFSFSLIFLMKVLRVHQPAPLVLQPNHQASPRTIATFCLHGTPTVISTPCFFFAVHLCPIFPLSRLSFSTCSHPSSSLLFLPNWPDKGQCAFAFDFFHSRFVGCSYDANPCLSLAPFLMFFFFPSNPIS